MTARSGPNVRKALRSSRRFGQPPVRDIKFLLFPKRPEDRGYQPLLVTSGLRSLRLSRILQ